MMNGIQIEALPYYEVGTLNLMVSASSFSFSGQIEVFTTPQALIAFGERLTSFPASTSDKVSFEYGSSSGEWAAHLLLEAAVIDGVGHSAIRVRMQSFGGPACGSLAEFSIPSEPAGINELGHAIVGWAGSPEDLFVWHLRA
jgi:hypothetical protein